MYVGTVDGEVLLQGGLELQHDVEPELATLG